MSELMSDLEGLLQKVEMSQICLADMIHDCKGKSMEKRRKNFEKKYYFMRRIEKTIRELRNKIKDFSWKDLDKGGSELSLYRGRKE